jgi:hypothetical protein
MARRLKKDGAPSPNSTEIMEGVNLLTDSKYGVCVDGAEETIEMYENGQISREQLYDTILNLDVVYHSRVESSEE